MLPSVLSERVCSLRHKVDRYSVSVIWTMDKNFKILNTWFGRTIINSSCEMEYEQAQQLLDGKSIVTGLGLLLFKYVYIFLRDFSIDPMIYRCTIV
jgi:DIS3-like exonuclease 1